MATYTVTINERTSQGKCLVEYLRQLGVLEDSNFDKEMKLTMQAIKEIKEGKGIRCKTFDDFKKSLK